MPEFGEPLTEREDTVMSMLASGMDIKAAAHVLDISDSMIGKYQNQVRAKLGAQTHLQAMHLWTMKRPIMERLLIQLGRLK